MSYFLESKVPRVGTFRRVHEEWVRRARAGTGRRLAQSEAKMFERLVDRMTDEATVLATEWALQEAEYSSGTSTDLETKRDGGTADSKIQPVSIEDPIPDAEVPIGFESMVYRGLKGEMLNASYLRNMRPGVMFTDPAIVSTSVRDMFDTTIMVQIRSKSGRWIGPLSALAITDEVLFTFGTRFMVMERTDDENAGKTFITLDEVD